MIKYLELALSQEVYEYLEELDEMNWSARGNVLNQYLRNTSIGTTVMLIKLYQIMTKTNKSWLIDIMCVRLSIILYIMTVLVIWYNVLLYIVVNC